MLKDDRNPIALAALPDEALIDAVQRRTFTYFWDGAHAASGLALDRRSLEGVTRDDRADDKVAIGGSGFGDHGPDRRGRARLGHARRGPGAPAAHARRLVPRHALPRRLPALHRRHERRDDPDDRHGRRGRSGRDLVPRHGPAVRAPVLQRGHGRGAPTARRHRHAVARRRMGLVHARRTRRPVLALEPEPRLGDEP